MHNELGLTLFECASLEHCASSLAEFAGSDDSSLRESLRRVFYSSLPDSYSHGEPFRVLSNVDAAPIVNGLRVELLGDAEGVRGTPISGSDVSSAVKGGVEQLARLAPNVYEALSLTINGVIVLDREHGSNGGSCSNLPGIMWLAPNRQWSALDYAENILHEAVHTRIFIEDMVWGLFSDDAGAEEHFVTSAVRRTRRRYDLAFHSAFVAHAVWRLRTCTGGFSGMWASQAPLVISLAGLIQHWNILTNRGQWHLRELVAAAVEDFSGSS